MSMKVVSSLWVNTVRIFIMMNKLTSRAAITLNTSLLPVYCGRTVVHMVW